MEFLISNNTNNTNNNINYILNQVYKFIMRVHVYLDLPLVSVM